MIEKPGFIAQLTHTPKHALADEHLPSGLAHELAEAGVEVIQPTYDVRALLDQALLMHDLGECVPADSLIPTYAREPEAVRIWRNRR